jgi:hypothetical protein
MVAARTAGVPACHALDGCPDRVLTVQACLDPLSTGFPPCATALGQFVKSGICQPSQSSRRITSARAAIELVGPRHNLLLQHGCRGPHGGVEHRGEGDVGRCGCGRVSSRGWRMMGAAPAVAAVRPLAQFDAALGGQQLPRLPGVCAPCTPTLRHLGAGPGRRGGCYREGHRGTALSECGPSVLGTDAILIDAARRLTR